jgi:hypothetical protein
MLHQHMHSVANIAEKKKPRFRCRQVACRRHTSLADEPNQLGDFPMMASVLHNMEVHTLQEIVPFWAAVPIQLGYKQLTLGEALESAFSKPQAQSLRRVLMLLGL